MPVPNRIWRARKAGALTLLAVGAMMMAGATEAASTAVSLGVTRADADVAAAVNVPTAQDVAAAVTAAAVAQASPSPASTPAPAPTPPPPPPPAPVAFAVPPAIPYTDCSGATPLGRSNVYQDMCVGVTVLMAHNPGMFTPVASLSVGDRVSYDGRTYTVTAKRVVPRTEILHDAASNPAPLVLDTCYDPAGTYVWGVWAA